jgi:uncharacterized alpha-E superfamily protein
MGIISLETTNRLYWLGRYSERVYTTILLFSRGYDAMIDGPQSNYATFCKKLDIPDIYTCCDDFSTDYCFNKDNPDSIYANLVRAYDNAILLRQDIGSDTLSYIQLAIYEMNKAKTSDAPLIELQKVLDNIMAFWGMAEDNIGNEQIRNILKIGKRIERIDLFSRFKRPETDINREVSRLTARLVRTSIPYRKENIDRLNDLVKHSPMDYAKIIEEVDTILEE